MLFHTGYTTNRPCCLLLPQLWAWSWQRTCCSCTMRACGRHWASPEVGGLCWLCWLCAAA